MGHCPNTALFSPPPPILFLTCPCQGSDLSFLGRYISIIWKKRFDAGDGGVAQKVANFPEGLLCPMPRRPLMVRTALLRRSCDGVATATESLLRWSCADQLRRAHSARRVRDGADAAATELMLRAALLRRSCDGVAAETSTPAPSRSFCAPRLDATR